MQCCTFTTTTGFEPDSVMEFGFKRSAMIADGGDIHHRVV